MSIIIWTVLSLLIIAFDQVTKYYVLSLGIHPGTTFSVLINNVLEFKYIRNRGMAWGTFQGGRWIFVAVTIIFIILIVGYIFKKRIKDNLFLCAASFMIGGGIGNLIDRISTGDVIDFIYFKLINFPIFNIADSFVVIGVILMIIYLLINKDADENARKS
ncbi:MAG: signal peptidase II [Bacillota bacterium]|nr:signal peptidase II [Bacillota bacterium]